VEGHLPSKLLLDCHFFWVALSNLPTNHPLVGGWAHWRHPQPASAPRASRLGFLEPDPIDPQSANAWLPLVGMWLRRTAPMVIGEHIRVSLCVPSGRRHNARAMRATIRNWHLSDLTRCSPKVCLLGSSRRALNARVSFESGCPAIAYRYSPHGAAIL